MFNKSIKNLSAVRVRFLRKFRMPLYRPNKRRFFHEDCFDQPILRLRHRLETWSERFYRLVVIAVHTNVKMHPKKRSKCRDWAEGGGI